MSKDQFVLEDASAKAQRNLLFKLLEKYGSISIRDLQKKWGIIDPRPRAWELRWKDGINIVTHYETIRDRYGNERRVGRYVLQNGKWQGGEK
jgi:hypothetical protein